jgi:acyl-CoA synthetase (AMP-forming)/AMP-acid ligase II
MSDNNIKFDVLDDDESLFKSNNETTTENPAIKNAEVTQDLTFEEKIREYVSTKNPCVYILTPCYGGMCYVDYLMCLMATVERFRNLGIELKVEFCKNDSLVSRARNNLIARAMNNPRMTHVIFIDSDIAWDPIDIVKLLIADKQLIGGIYPLKHYDWNELIKDKTNPYNSNVIQSWINRKNQSQFKDVISDDALVQQKLLKYNVNYLHNTLSIEKNLAEVRHLATGFMMIKRNVLDKMSKAYPSTKYVDDVQFLSGTENDFAYALFDCGVIEDHYMSEDWLFCERWRKMGGKIFIDVSIPLSHTGSETYRGCYLSSLL